MPLDFLAVTRAGGERKCVQGVVNTGGVKRIQWRVVGRLVELIEVQGAGGCGGGLFGSGLGVFGFGGSILLLFG